MMTGEYFYKDIFFSWQEDTLTLGNRSFRRVIDFSGGLPKSRSLEFNGTQVAAANDKFDFVLAGFPPETTTRVFCNYTLKGHYTCNLQSPDGDGYVMNVEIFESLRELEITLSYIVYPELPVMAVEASVRSAVTPLMSWHPRQKAEHFHCSDNVHGTLNIVDSVRFNDFKVVKSVEFQLRTDYIDEPVVEHGYDGSELYGNILIARNSSGKEFFFLQEAPPSMERRGDEPGDFVVRDNGLWAGSLGSGITADDVQPGKLLKLNRLVCGMADDGDASMLIKRYWRTRQQHGGKFSSIITVNPWGCGCFPSLLSEDFLKEEIAAAGRVNADVYQIDDGYQHGGLADMCVHNRKLDKEYWQPRKDLLPEGFKPLLKTAAENNVALSLWFAASCNRNYCDWRESADILLEHFRNGGFTSFKLDAVLFNSYDGEENFGRLLKALHDESNGRISVNLDVTNGTRGGICKFTEYGLLFLENRYCCHSWVRHPYHPENTLDNLWNLAGYCRTQSLQIEIPDPGNINPECYKQKNMALPDEYSLEYWALIPFFASPLLWMTPSRLSEENSAVLAKLMLLHKKYRQYWRDALVKPVGSRPTGASISGFYADSGYLLVFREKNAPESCRLDLPEFSESEILYATTGVVLEKNGVIKFTKPASAALIKIA